jgi:hypothetical protein
MKARLWILGFFLLATLLPRTRIEAAQDSQRLDRSMGVHSYPIRIFYADGQERVAHKIADICETSIPELAEALGLGDVSPFQIQVVGNFKANAGGTMNDLPAWGVAFAFMKSQVMLIDAKRATQAWNTLEKVVPHELSHLLLAQRVGLKPMPLWFVEGLAEWQAGQWSLLENWYLMEAVWTGRAIPLSTIERVFPREERQASEAYRIAYIAFTFRLGKEVDRLPVFMNRLARADSFEEAFQEFWGESLGDFYIRFQRELDRRYTTRFMIFQSGPLFTLVAVAVILIFIRLKIRNRRKLKRMEMIERGLSLDDD